MSSLTENDTEPKVKRARHNDDSVSSKSEGSEDRLSDLPDCVLIHLMTFLRTKDSVRTGVLSQRWKGLWKRVPSLMLSTWDFLIRRMTLFNKFVPKVLSLRDSSVPLNSLDFHHSGHIPPQLLIRLVRYAASHSIECLKLSLNCCIDLPPGIFSCQTLRSLDLSVYTSFPKSLNMTALTSLSVRNMTFCADEKNLVEPFSSCVNLKTLVIHCHHMRQQQILCISNATLVNLTIHSRSFYEKDAYKIVLSTPNLCSFTFSGHIAQQLTASNLSCLKEVNIDVPFWSAYSSSQLYSAFILISWLQVFANIRSLKVCSRTLKVLFLIPDLLNTESPCLDNLKSLIVNVGKPLPQCLKPLRAARSKKAQLKPPSPPIPDGVVDYLIRNSPFAKVTITNC